MVQLSFTAIAIYDSDQEKKNKDIETFSMGLHLTYEQTLLDGEHRRTSLIMNLTLNYIH